MREREKEWERESETERVRERVRAEIENEIKREEEGGEIKGLCCLCVILHYYQITLTEL